MRGGRLNFTMVRGAQVSMEAGGVVVRERGWYEEGNHQTALDFLRPGLNSVALLIWQPTAQPRQRSSEEQEEEQEFEERERVEVCGGGARSARPVLRALLSPRRPPRAQAHPARS